MKTILTLIILAFSVCSFGQSKSAYAKKFKEADKAFDQAAKDAAVKTDKSLVKIVVDEEITPDDLGTMITTNPPQYEPSVNEKKRAKLALRDTAISDTLTIHLQPYQKQILSKLDSVQKAFAADVEKNKEVIATFNALMQRSASIQERSKDAQDLIFGDNGIDPKKYRISGGDLIKGTLKIERIK